VEILKPADSALEQFKAEPINPYDRSHGLTT
jgi:hypothetical protein